MAEDGIAGTHGSHGCLAEGVVLQFQITLRLVPLKISWLNYVKACTVESKSMWAMNVTVLYVMLSKQVDLPGEETSARPQFQGARPK